MKYFSEKLEWAARLIFCSLSDHLIAWALWFNRRDVGSLQTGITAVSTPAQFVSPGISPGAAGKGKPCSFSSANSSRSVAHNEVPAKAVNLGRGELQPRCSTAEGVGALSTNTPGCNLWIPDCSLLFSTARFIPCTGRSDAICGCW